MTLIIYDNDAIYSDRRVVEKQIFSTRFKDAPKQFLNKEKDIAIAISGEIPKGAKLEQLFDSIYSYLDYRTTLEVFKIVHPAPTLTEIYEVRLDKMEKLMMEYMKLMSDIFPAVTLVMTTRHTFVVRNDHPAREIGMVEIHDIEAKDSFWDGNGAPLYERARGFGLSVPESYQRIGEIEHHVSSNYDVIYRSKLRRMRLNGRVRRKREKEKQCIPS